MPVKSIPSYQGREPYIAACFADADRKRVMPLLAELYARRFRVVFDEKPGCSGAEADEIATRIANAALTLLFISDNATQTPLWRYEVNYAIDQKQRLVAVYLTDTALERGMELQLSNVPGFSRTECADAEAFFAKFTAMPGVSHELIGDGEEGYPPAKPKPPLWQRPWFLISLAALAVSAALIGILGAGSGQAETIAAPSAAPGIRYVETVAFSEPLLTQYVQACYGRSAADALFLEDLPGISSIRIYGSLPAPPDSVAQKSGTRLFVDGQEVRKRGDVSYLRELTLFENLTWLALPFQAVTDIKELTELSKLEVLDLSNNEIADLSPLADCQSLRALDLSFLPATDYEPLLALTGLERLSIGGNGPEALEIAAQMKLTALSLAMTEAPDMALVSGMLSLRELNLSGTGITSLAPLAALSGLETLNLAGCADFSDADALKALPNLKEVTVSAEQAGLIQALSGMEGVTVKIGMAG